MYYWAKSTPQFEYKVSFTRWASRVTGKIAQIPIPASLRSTLFGLYAKSYGVILEDITKPLEEFTTFNDFFTREVKPRPIDARPNVLLSPADSKILSLSEVTEDSCLLIKGFTYQLGELLTGEPTYVAGPKVLESMKKRPEEKTKLYQCIFYLAPGDYHRFHAPTDILLRKRNHITGYLEPVKESFLPKRPTVYQKNERIAVFGETPFGFMSVIFVGALNVGSITLTFEKDLKTNPSIADVDKHKNISAFDYTTGKQIPLFEKLDVPREEPAKVVSQGIVLKKGDEMGRFNLGSTVVLVFEAPEQFKWNVKIGDRVRMGDVVGLIPTQPEIAKS
eukprot:TRINITY_DN6272_c0_g1_i14.p1 TRINITY_DN6272_c0_g1~~TRINITY_DN6272_c0_g1_i14.p1  ORF type:complete len:334 (+),score=65.56 TRINITY_DN6272_c0_g1_i14:202-1203(+)